MQESKLPNYYAMLGVPNDADQKQIKSRYRQLVKELHPDKSKDENTSERLAEISKAYKILSDAEKRKTYDAYYKASVG
jgi:DnaJ-class molecular chaperone